MRILYTIKQPVIVAGMAVTSVLRTDVMYAR